MASITFAIDEHTLKRMEKFSWVNWSEVAREGALKRDTLASISARLQTKEEQELINWSVKLGRKLKKEVHNRLRDS